MTQTEELISIPYKVVGYTPVLICQFDHPCLLHDMPLCIDASCPTVQNDALGDALKVLETHRQHMMNLVVSVSPSINIVERGAEAARLAMEELKRVIATSPPKYWPDPQPLYRPGNNGHAGLAKIVQSGNLYVQRNYQETSPLAVAPQTSPPETGARIKSVSLWGKVTLAIDIGVQKA